MEQEKKGVNGTWRVRKRHFGMIKAAFLHMQSGTLPPQSATLLAVFATFAYHHDTLTQKTCRKMSCMHGPLPLLIAWLT